MTTFNSHCECDHWKWPHPCHSQYSDYKPISLLQEKSLCANLL